MTSCTSRGATRTCGRSKLATRPTARRTRSTRPRSRALCARCGCAPCRDTCFLSRPVLEVLPPEPVSWVILSNLDLPLLCGETCRPATGAAPAPEKPVSRGNSTGSVPCSALCSMLVEHGRFLCGIAASCVLLLRFVQGSEDQFVLRSFCPWGLGFQP
jgi:hypothetical protein